MKSAIISRIVKIRCFPEVCFFIWRDGYSHATTGTSPVRPLLKLSQSEKMAEKKQKAIAATKSLILVFLFMGNGKLNSCELITAFAQLAHK